MTRKVHVTPGGLTAMQAKIGIVVAAFFLLFGLIFGAIVGLETPASEGRLRLLCTPVDFFDEKHVGKYFLMSTQPIVPWIEVCV